MMRQAFSVQRTAFTRAILGSMLLAIGVGGRMSKADEQGTTAAPKTFGSTAPQPVKAELIAEHTSIQISDPPRVKSQTRVGVCFEIEPGWHIYAENPGDAGLPTQIIWSGPGNATFGPLHWPLPEQFVDPGEIHTNGYTGKPLLYSTLTLAPSKLLGKEVPVYAKVKWLACKEICVPGKTNLSLTLPVSASPPQLSAHSEMFEHTN